MGKKPYGRPKGQGWHFTSPEMEAQWKEKQRIAQRKNMTEEKKEALRAGTRKFMDTYPEVNKAKGKHMSQTPGSIAGRNKLHQKQKNRGTIKRNTEMYKNNDRIKPVIKPLPHEDADYYENIGDFFAEGL